LKFQELFQDWKTLVVLVYPQRAKGFQHEMDLVFGEFTRRKLVEWSSSLLQEVEAKRTQEKEKSHLLEVKMTTLQGERDRATMEVKLKTETVNELKKELETTKSKSNDLQSRFDKLNEESNTLQR
jgi:chromosome segregation ATPase